MKLKLLLIIFLIPLYSNAQNMKENFSVVVEGTRSHLDYVKARSELTMSRSTKFCRGSKMPKSVGEWSCINTAPRLSNCVLEYKCQFVNKRFNRLSESRRLRNNLKDIPHLKSKYRISLLYKDKKEVLEEISNKTFIMGPSKKVVASNFSSQKLKSSNSKFKEMKQKQIKLKQQARVKRKAIVKKKTPVKKVPIRIKKITKKQPKTMSETEMELEDIFFLKDDESIRENDNKEVISLKEEEIEEISKEEVSEDIVLKEEQDKVTEEKEESNFDTKLSLKNFSFSYISISDSNETSLTTLGLSWTPHIWFSKHFAVRGNLGFHMYESVETELVESQSFLIYDIAAYGQYLFTNIFFEMGYGIQKWNVEGAEGMSSLSFGAGYRFDEKKLYILDRVSFEMSSLSNEAATKELKLNIGASF